MLLPRLLVLACSDRKRSDSGLLPALERYDGPAFQVLRRYLNQHPTESLSVYILSARFGLIPAQQAIGDYDQRMTPQRAGELQPSVLAELERQLHRQTYSALFVNLGRDYLPALAGYEARLPQELPVTKTSGALGRRLVDLRRWLYRDTDSCYPAPTSVRRSRPVQLRGVEITQTTEQIMESAHQALKQGIGNPSAQAWYVLVDEKRVAPKWLVSQLTGLPTRAFHSGEARRVLQQLGIPIYVQ